MDNNVLINFVNNVIKVRFLTLVVVKQQGTTRIAIKI